LKGTRGQGGFAAPLLGFTAQTIPSGLDYLSPSTFVCVYTFVHMISHFTLHEAMRNEFYPVLHPLSATTKVNVLGMRLQQCADLYTFLINSCVMLKPYLYPLPYPRQATLAWSGSFASCIHVFASPRPGHNACPCQPAAFAFPFHLYLFYLKISLCLLLLPLTLQASSNPIIK
jgi:hypothetical protein